MRLFSIYCAAALFIPSLSNVVIAEDESMLFVRSTEQPQGPANTTRETIVLKLQADAQGALMAVFIAGRPQPLTGSDVIKTLGTQVKQWVNTARSAGQSDPEIALDIDDQLRYDALKQVLATISESRDENGLPYPLVKRVRFGHTPKPKVSVKITPREMKIKVSDINKFNPSPKPTQPLPPVRQSPQ